MSDETDVTLHEVHDAGVSLDREEMCEILAKVVGARLSFKGEVHAVVKFRMIIDDPERPVLAGCEIVFDRVKAA